MLPRRIRLLRLDRVTTLRSMSAAVVVRRPRRRRRPPGIDEEENRSYRPLGCCAATTGMPRRRGRQSRIRQSTIGTSARSRPLARPPPQRLKAVFSASLPFSQSIPDMEVSIDQARLSAHYEYPACSGDRGPVSWVVFSERMHAGFWRDRSAIQYYHLPEAGKADIAAAKAINPNIAVQFDHSESSVR